MTPQARTSGSGRLAILCPALLALGAVMLSVSSVAEGSIGLLHASRSAMVLGFVGLRRVAADASLIVDDARD